MARFLVDGVLVICADNLLLGRAELLDAVVAEEFGVRCSVAVDIHPA